MLPSLRANCVFAGILLAVIAVAQRAHAADTALQREDALWIDRITYGLDTSTVERFVRLGRHGFLNEQLSGKNDVLPAPVQAQIDALDISRVPARQLLAEEVTAQQRIKSMSDDARLQERKVRMERLLADLA